MKKSIEQEKAIELILKMQQGERLFLTGGAGTGKSFIIKEISKHRDCILIASTGEAAENINSFILKPWHKGYGKEFKKRYKTVKTFLTDRARTKRLGIYLPYTLSKNRNSRNISKEMPDSVPPEKLS